RAVVRSPRYLHQKIERHRRRKLRRATEAAIDGIVALRDARGRAIERVVLQRSAALKLDGTDAADHFRRGRVDVAAAIAVRMRDMIEDAPEARHAVPVVR